MATIRKGNTAVLLVVDMQVGVVSNAWESLRVIEQVTRVVGRARKKGVPVLWVRHSDDELLHGTPEWQWVAQLQPTPVEPCIDKHFNSAFEQTALEKDLANLDATHIVLAGAATNWCIRATAYGALDRGYDLTLLRDAHTTETIDLGDGTKIEAAAIVQEFNIAMTWSSYPGRMNRTALSEEYDFSRPGGAQ